MAEATYSNYIAEYVGTYLLVLTVGCNVITGSPVWAATSIACVLMVSIYALGAASGANFNPAVSVALGLSKRMEWPQVGCYCAIQLAAGSCAGLTYLGMFGKSFNLAPGTGFEAWQAGLAEVLYTFMLCFVVLNVAAVKDSNQYFGLAIGFVIIAGGYAAGNISGGAFNPAVALGIDLSSAGLGFGYCIAYTIFELIGAAAAAGLFRVVRPDEFGGEKPYTMGPKLVSELIGTYFLVLTVGLNVLGKSPAVVWSIAASLMCMIYALGPVSGAHFNPAVTVAIIAAGRGKCSASEGGAYIGVQIAGGILAALTFAGLHSGASFPLAPGKDFTMFGAAIAEILFTFVLCFVVLCVATVREPSKDMFGLIIGSCVTCGGYAIGAVSGGSLNPAVSIGISSAHTINGGLFYNCLIYSFFELIGAGLAAGAFMVTHPSEYQKSFLPCKQ